MATIRVYWETDAQQTLIWDVGRTYSSDDFMKAVEQSLMMTRTLEHPFDLIVLSNNALPIQVNPSLLGETMKNAHPLQRFFAIVGRGAITDMLIKIAEQRGMEGVPPNKLPIFADTLLEAKQEIARRAKLDRVS
ncbi:MAG: hypothetical protein GYB67_10955 [Chloroflexi bacterium]|nr:hypothetical protein [Chloroflexota bacterium]